MSDSEGDARAASKKERRQKKKKQQASADASADASAEANVDGGEIQMAVEPTVQTAVAPPLTVIEPDDGDAHLMVRTAARAFRASPLPFSVLTLFVSAVATFFSSSFLPFVCAYLFIYLLVVLDTGARL